MKYIELAPGTLEKHAGNAWGLLAGKECNVLIEKANAKYHYWDKVKHQNIPSKFNKVDFWWAIKLSRMTNSKTLEFHKEKFTYCLTDNLQQKLHEFDLNLGGSLRAQTAITQTEKENYLIGSIMEEAIASSQIEGAVTTRKKAKEILRKSKKPVNKSEQMIVNNYLTIKHIVENKDKPLTKEALFEIHKLITYNTLNAKKDEGEYRTSNEFDVVDAKTNETVYTPPNHKEVPQLMTDFFTFFNDETPSFFIHPIIKACIVHFMIGYIHPFVDGNGRTARALFYWYMLKKKYWLTEYLSISRIIMKSRTKYGLAYRYTEMDDNDLTYFLSYKINAIHLAFEEMKKYIERKEKEKKKYLNLHKITELGPRQVHIISWMIQNEAQLLTVKEIESRFGVSNQTARNDLDRLTRMKFLEEIQLDKKSKGFAKSNNFDELIKKALN